MIPSPDSLLDSRLHSVELHIAPMKAQDTLAIVAGLAGCDDPLVPTQQSGVLHEEERMTLFGNVLVGHLVEEGRCVWKGPAPNNAVHPSIPMLTQEHSDCLHI